MSEQSVLEVDVLKARNTGKYKDVSDFDKGHIVIARPLGQSISVPRMQYLPKVVQRAPKVQLVHMGRQR